MIIDNITGVNSSSPVTRLKAATLGLLREKTPKLWALISLLLISLAGIELLQPPEDYPQSKIFIDPGTGKYSRFLEEWVAPRISIDGDTVIIDIDMEDQMSDSSPNRAALVALSPVLRMHPDAKLFKVSWTWNSGFDRWGGNELLYNRSTGRVSFNSKWSLFGKHYNKTELTATGIKDRQIHDLASKVGPYTDLGH